MDIQYISFEGSKISGENITDSLISSPKDFDDFSVNFIDLSNQKLWSEIVGGYYSNGTEYEKDFITISQMIGNTKNRIVILMPQNKVYQYGIKDYLVNFYKGLGLITNIPIELFFGTTQTQVNDQILTSDFTFKELNESLIKLTSSIKGNKPTTIRYQNIYFTTLNISNHVELKKFMIETNLVSTNNKEIPEWMEEVKMFDDRQQMDTIRIKEQQIQELKNKITTAQEILSKNERLKSILYTQSDSLVEVVFEIFEEILDVDLSEFEDKKIEDISFAIGDMIFIGEIKGITSNVKTPNLSQLDNHYTNFVEEHPEIPEESIYKLLIVNHQRKRPVSERDPIDHKQIELAENKYTSLIIETSELLKLLEKHRDKSISKEEIIDLLTKNGLLKIK